MKKLTKIFSFALAFVCLSLCFAGCSFGKEAELSSIDLSTPLQNEFCLGETLDLTGKKLTLTYTDDTQKEINLTESMFISKLDTTTATTTQPRTMVIKYKEKTTTCNYTVLNAKKVGSNKLYFDKAYVLTSVEKFKNDASVGLDTSNAMLGMKITFNQNGTALNTESDGTLLTTLTWSINDDNTIQLSSISTTSTVTYAITLNQNGFTTLVTTSYDASYDAMLETFTLQNA